MDKISRAHQYMEFLSLRSKAGVDRDEAIREYLFLMGRTPIEPTPKMDTEAPESERIDPPPISTM